MSPPCLERPFTGRDFTMTQMTWNFASRAAQYVAPTMRVYVSRVATAAAGAAGAAAEWLQETYAPWWQPLQLAWHANGKPTTLTLRRVLGQGPGKPGRDRPELLAFLPGDRVRLVEVQAGGGCAILREWFRGCVAQDRTLVDGGAGGESYELVAYGPELLLAGKVVSGQWHATPAADGKIIAGACSPGDLIAANIFRGHLPVVFNAGGEPNASNPTIDGAAALWRLDGRGEAPAPGARTFDAPGRIVRTAEASYEATFWTVGAAVQSLIEAVDGYELISPRSMGLLDAALFAAPLGEVDAEGLDLPSALRRVLRAAGWGFAVEPWAGRDGRHVLNVFPLRGEADGARVRRPFMAPLRSGGVGITDADAQRAEVQRVEFVRDSHNVRNEVAVVGDRKRRQVALSFRAAGGELKCAWDRDAHDLADWATDDVVDPMQWPCDEARLLTVRCFEENYTYGAPGAAETRHVFRGFAWNEDGAFNAVCGAMGDPAAAGLAVGGNFLRRPRPVGPTLLRDDDLARARNLPAFVQLGVDGDETSWIEVPAVIWRDRAGFTIPVNPLWAWYPYADEYARHAGGTTETLFGRYGELSYLTLLHNALRGQGEGLALRLVGSMESDEAVVGLAPRRLSSSWPFVARKVVRAEERLVGRQVPDEADVLSLGAARRDERDDAADAAALAGALRDTMADEVGHGSLILRHVTRSYAPGDVVPQTQGRVIDLTVRGGQRRYAPVVAGVVWNFQHGASRTELLLDSALVRVTQ